MPKTEPILNFTMRLWPGDEPIADWLSKLSAETSRTDVIRALIYIAAGIPLPMELRGVSERFEGLYVSQAPSAAAPIVNVTIDTTPIADALRGGQQPPFTDPPTRPKWPQ